MHFENFYFNNFVLKNAELNIKKEKKATQVFQNFGLVRKGQTNIFLFFLDLNIRKLEKI